MKQQRPRKGPKAKAGTLFKSLFALLIAGTLAGTLVVGAGLWFFSRGLPKIATVADYRPQGVTRIFADEGEKRTLIGEFFKERRYLVEYEKIPEMVVSAFISAEDDAFFQHQGINPASILRAAIVNFKAGQVVQGGSTITQQVAKSLLLTPERSFSRKFKEVLLAAKMERDLSKQEILFLYLNQIYLGRGAYGVQAASQAYFSKDVSQLTLEEAALIAGLPQAPGKYGPHLNPDKAKKRQLYVLRRMHENNYISQAQMTEAAAKPVRISYEEDINQKFAPYLVEHIRRHLTEKFGEKALYEDALEVSVPSPVSLSIAATASVREGLRAIDKRRGYRGPVKRLKNQAEIEAFLGVARADAIRRAVPYMLFLPEGRIDPVAAMQEAGITDELSLLRDGDLYQAVVSVVDDKKKSASALVGGAKLEIPLEKMKWARAWIDGKSVGAEPSAPSRVLRTGDVVWIRVTRQADRSWAAALEQEPQVQGALVSLDVNTGAVLAMVGGYDFTQSEFNRAIQAQRQPGSALKPLIYSAGLEKGFTPASVIIDAPLTFEEGEAGKWRPANFEEKFYGDTTFRQALIKSRNVPTIRIVQEVGVSFLIDYMKRLGMTSEFPRDLSIALGSATVSPMELARVYSLFPRMGRQTEPVFFTSVKARDGKVLEENQLTALKSPATPPPVEATEEGEGVAKAETPKVTGRAQLFLPSYPLPQDPGQILDPRVAYVMTHLMKEVVNYGTGYEAKSLGRPAAGKTGTTNDYLDAWFTGFTPQVVTVVWTGFDSQQPLGPGETGAKASLPIWLSFMKEAVKAFPTSDFAAPPGVVFATIDSNSGKGVPSSSSRAIREAFIEGTEPSRQSAEAPASDSSGDFLKEDFQ